MENKRTHGLTPGFTPLGIWAFSIGTSIGWGSFYVTCSTYLQKSGLLGTVFGMLLGMGVILVITWNLQYMIRTAPNAGGVYTFERHIGGKDLGFLAFWFVLLTYLAILWANMTSVPLFARFFLGDTFQFGWHYRIFGYEVWLGEALLSITALVLVGVLCARSSRLPNGIMIVAALTFAIGFTVCALLAVLRHESTFSYEPRYIEGSDAFVQIIRIAVISPWAFIGFENISHFSEEYTFPVKKVRGILVCSVLATTVLYLFVSVLSITAYPPEYASWHEYIQDMGNLQGMKAVPAFYAADHYLGQTGVGILMLALFGAILTSLIGNTLALSRLLYAAGREHDAPAFLTDLNERGIPDKAIFTVIGISLLVPFVGRTAIGWIVDVTTLGASLIYGLISYAVFRCAHLAKHRIEMGTGLVGGVFMVSFVLLLLIPGLLPFDAMETESYFLFIVWSLLGLAYFRRLVRRDRYQEHDQRIVVWLILLVLVLFASMMWASRATEEAANRAVENIYRYSNTDTDSSRREREAFFEEQARKISSTNTVYSVASLGVFLLSVAMMLNNYRDVQHLGQRLSAAEEAARAAKKIADLQQSITTMMHNMPAMSFSKDAETGIYLACNQSFAEFAHKDNPENVVGLTDEQIFDPVTAAHFVEDDRMALSMDEPYIFTENVLDASGEPRQIQTTKLKYTDDVGRLCVLGMSQDMTAFVRVQRENNTTKEAYEKARKNSFIYSHIAQSLAKSYTDLFYVDLTTEEYIEFHMDKERDTLVEERQGERFFEECKIEAELYVYPDDRELFLKAMDRETLLSTLARNNNNFITSYRLIGEHEPVYVSLKATCMRDDQDVMIIGVSDVDEHTKARQMAERLKEERIAYTRINALTGDFICVYVVVPETGRYREYSATRSYKSLEIPQQGMDFFGETRKNALITVHPDDLERFLSLFSKEGVLSEIERSGIFAMSYRIILDGKAKYVRLKAAMVNEKEGRRLIIGLNDIDTHVRQEEEYQRRLNEAQNQANIDALTGVKNKHAYLKTEEELDRQIGLHRQSPFAVVLLDINDLKKVNDNEGHKAGDLYLQKACRIICRTFSHSPVFRVGGDEFAVISQGEDYDCIEELTGDIFKHNAKAVNNGGIVIACGMSKYSNSDTCVASVFERADHLMYENKNSLKRNKAKSTSAS